MTQLERDIERALVVMVKRRGGLCLKWVCPGFAGVPDRIVLLPRGRIVFVEVKRPRGGKLSQLQMWWAGKLGQLGFDHWVVWNYKDLDTFRVALFGEEDKT